MEEIGIKEDLKMLGMFCFWKDNAELPPLRPESVVGTKGICPTGEPIKDDVPLKDLVDPVPQGQKYGAE